MIGALLLIVLGILGAMQAPVWAVPVFAAMIGGMCSMTPALRRRMGLPVLWGAVLAASLAVYGMGFALGLTLLP